MPSNGSFQRVNNPAPNFPYKMILFFGILSIGTLTIIFSLSNLILTAILLLYFVYSILQFYPYSMTNTFYEILLRPFFKILILSSIAFFSQANFIPLQLQYELLPLILFHIFGLIQIQVKNTAGSDRPMTYYQQLLMKHSKSLKMTSFLLAYATANFQILNLSSSLWAIILFGLSALLVFPLFKRRFQATLRIEQYLVQLQFSFHTGLFLTIFGLTETTGSCTGRIDWCSCLFTYKKKALKRVLCNDDPYGNRTRVTAVKGRCLNRLTNGP